MKEMIFTNARVVLADEVIAGTVFVKNGLIADVSEGSCAVAGAEDFEGDLLLPGLVELHTDALEGHMRPRPNTDWPAIAAVVAHDNQLAASGITTVLDALALGTIYDTNVRVKRLQHMIDGVALARETDLWRADHLLHLRCEVSFERLPEIFDDLSRQDNVRLVSLMDHTPGQRQFVSEDHYRVYFQGKHGLSDPEMDAFIAARREDQVKYSAKYRRYIVDACRARGIALASHDDATAEHVAEAVADGVVIAEFPTTVAAAKASHESGMQVLMGGPNLVRGGSHSGNVSARDLAEAGYLDIVSSDYVPSSLLHAAFILADLMDGKDLAKAIRTVTKNPAESAGLSDRGEIAAGRRADVVRVFPLSHYPVVRSVWREGKRVA